MKRSLNIFIALVYSALFALSGSMLLSQEPPRHDKHRDEEHAFCLPAKPSPGTQGHECHCKMMCATNQDGDTERAYEVEDSTCEMYCTKARCACHPEETCDVPTELPTTKPERIR